MKTILGTLLAVGLALGASVSAQIDGPLTSNPLSFARVGSMGGHWNLPLNSALGVAGGTLNFGIPQFQFVADLPAEAVSVDAQGFVRGSFQGGLRSFPLTPGATYDFAVHGQWRWNPNTGKGFYQGFITTVGLPKPSGVPILLIGTMRGSFEDRPPISPLGPDPLGSFKGLWVFNFLSTLGPTPIGMPFPGPDDDDA